jgi:adenine-specific DNA-methyltransferase
MKDSHSSLSENLNIESPSKRRVLNPNRSGWLGMQDALPYFKREADLAAVANAMGASSVRGLSPAEKALLDNLPRSRSLFLDQALQHVQELVHKGRDPLGDAFCSLRPPEHRRRLGATYTPAAIVESMLDWAVSQIQPERIIDPGTGSGRFLLAAARRFPKAKIIGLEIDPLPACLARANIAAAGLQNRAEVILGDFRSYRPPPISGPTLYVGNPPYVRHHLIEPKWKDWLTQEGNKLGARTSQLAGLHAYFFLATVQTAARGDCGAFITAAEWLDVNYGSVIRDLFLGGLGGQRIIVIEPTALPFPDAATTAAVTCFKIGAKPKSIQMNRVMTIAELDERKSQREIRRERLEAEPRWSHLTRTARKIPEGYVELGELCRVHRGQVTGANRVWIAGPHSAGLPPSVLFPTVTKAMELFRAGDVLADNSLLRCVIDIPVDLSTFAPSDRRRIEHFLTYARDAGAHLGYVASNRKAWWSVGLRTPAPILATYMARRPPAFVHNLASARHINIAHGLYPREPMSGTTLKKLAKFLSDSTCLTEGRTYAGGLTKFEPREMERLLVPDFRISPRFDA